VPIFSPYVQSRTEIPLINDQLAYLEKPLINYCRNLLRDHQSLVQLIEKNIAHITISPNAIISDDEITQHALDYLTFDTLPIDQQHAFITLIKTVQNSN
jgi:hypothetical protein